MEPTTVSKLINSFFLSILQIRMVMDKDGKPKGYAFVEYDRERDMNGKRHCTLTLLSLAILYVAIL